VNDTTTFKKIQESPLTIFIKKVKAITRELSYQKCTFQNNTQKRKQAIIVTTRIETSRQKRKLEVELPTSSYIPVVQITHITNEKTLQNTG
jgi:hypothetical protein